MNKLKCFGHKCLDSATRFHRNDTGAMSIEKVLLILVIVIPIVVALVAFREKLVGFFTDDSDKVLDKRAKT